MASTDDPTTLTLCAPATAEVREVMTAAQKSIERRGARSSRPTDEYEPRRVERCRIGQDRALLRMQERRAADSPHPRGLRIERLSQSTARERQRIIDPLNDVDWWGLRWQWRRWRWRSVAAARQSSRRHWFFAWRVSDRRQLALLDDPFKACSSQVVRAMVMCRP
eukprot:3682470-Prymnesium_polylepis.1